MTTESRERRVAALTALALATREKLDRAAFVVFVDGSAHVPTEIFESACRRLALGSSWFPRLHDLLEECRLVARVKSEAGRRLALPAGDRPITPEHLADLRRRVAEAVERRRM